MDYINMLIEFIQNVGFPMAVAIYLFKDQRDTREKQAEERKGFTVAIENNTVILNRVVDELKDLEDKIDGK